MDYSVNIKNFPFGFEVVRTDGAEVLFNTSDIPLIVSFFMFTHYNVISHVTMSFHTLPSHFTQSLTHNHNQ